MISRFTKSLSTLILAVLFACQSNKVHHLSTSVPTYGWVYPTGNINIEFTMKDSVNPYKLTFFITNTDKYKFCNLYYQYRLYDTAGKTLSARLKSIDLYDCKTGEPTGKGSTGIFTSSDLLIENIKFPYIGKYGLELMQYMRLDTLKDVQTVGFSVEKNF